MLYVPPAPRKANATKTPAVLGNPNPTNLGIAEIQHHYWSAENQNEDVTPPIHNTLNDSVKSKGSLSHVLLFHQANPRWKSDGIIFVKSNLDILPDYHKRKAEHALEDPPKAGVDPISPSTEGLADTSDGGVKKDTTETKQEETQQLGENVEDEAEHEGKPQIPPNDTPELEIVPSTTSPVAMFEQAPKKMRTEGFEFTGYYVIERIAILAPYSEVLARMLEQKWKLSDSRGNVKIKARRPEDWQKSLSYEWAVIKFKKMEGKNVPSEPKIEKMPPRQRRPFVPQTELADKSVNEMLEEMRFGKAPKEAVTGKDAKAEVGKALDP